MRGFLFCSVNLALLATLGARLGAQTPAAPTVYTVTQINSMFGPSVGLKIYRNGSKAVTDHIDVPGGVNSHTRTLYDLQAGRSFSWDVSGGPSAPCGAATFSGDWGDPFASSADMSAELTKANAKQVGTETVNGFATKVYEANTPEVKAKAWVESKSNALIKLEMAQPGGELKTMLEIKEMSFTPPPASIFTLPAGCAAAAATPPPPTPAERIAAITGGDPKDFVDAMRSGASPNSCTVAIRVVHAGSMQAITSGFQIALDTTFDPQNPPHYVTGLSDTLNSTFAGGGVHEVTSQLRNGVLRIPNAPAQFHLELTFGKPGSVDAAIYRQCLAPQTVLLLVLKNPAKISDGADWLWVKSGKYATVTP